MRFRIEFPTEVERDYALIFCHLFESCRSFGTRVEAALDHCEYRIRNNRTGTDQLGVAPYRRERYDDMLLRLPQLTINRAICWFYLSEAQQRARARAIFSAASIVHHIFARLLWPQLRTRTSQRCRPRRSGAKQDGTCPSASCRHGDLPREPSVYGGYPAFRAMLTLIRLTRHVAKL